MDRLITLGKALEAVNDSSYDAYFFLPPDEVWNADTPCAVIEIDPYDDSDDDPAFARTHGLRKSLSVPQAQDVVRNAREQLGSPTAQQLVTAFLFYYDRDAFISFTDR